MWNVFSSPGLQDSKISLKLNVFSTFPFLLFLYFPFSLIVECLFIPGLQDSKISPVAILLSRLNSFKLLLMTETRSLQEPRVKILHELS